MGEGCDLLVVAAFAPELEGLRAYLAEGLRAGEAEVSIRKQANELRNVLAEPVGIGLVASALGTATRVDMARPRAVVLVGTCGAYPGTGHRVGDVVVARAVTLVGPAVEEGRAALPEVMTTRLDTDNAIGAALAASGAARVTVATTLAVTTDDGLAAKLGRSTGADVEHLEAFAVASACAARNLPFAALLGVANAVGSTGRAEWRAGHMAAGEAAARVVVEWMRAGGQGVTRG